MSSAEWRPFYLELIVLIKINGSLGTNHYLLKNVSKINQLIAIAYFWKQKNSRRVFLNCQETNAFFGKCVFCV